MTLHLLSKFARRTQPRGDAGTSAPTGYPSSSVGALPTSLYCLNCGQPSGPFAPLVPAGITMYSCARCGWKAQLSFIGNVTIVEGDGPLESGVTPSPSIDTDRLNKLLIEAAATMREQTDRLAWVRAALENCDEDLRDNVRPVLAYGDAIAEIRRAMLR